MVYALLHILCLKTFPNHSLHFQFTKDKKPLCIYFFPFQTILSSLSSLNVLKGCCVLFAFNSSFPIDLFTYWLYLLPTDDIKIAHKAHDHQAAKIIASFCFLTVDLLKAPDTMGFTQKTAFHPACSSATVLPSFSQDSSHFHQWLIFFQFSLKY